MPPSVSPDTAAPSASVPRWVGAPARSLRKLIGQGAGGSSIRDWAASPKARQKSRRPVWE
ncbi:hypothetical protein [Caulobacter sp. BK020]|uniref:hypothetical protein n=1 Tax=Caulobacter sp. BK020 TaxID=2512117 RepID=UPI00104C3C0E|nr:hypothetical protein [Caulobacter sp. BK020]TCS13956.1 hypothetical protein EV278_1082 [Caulobacter sp. BK020]